MYSLLQSLCLLLPAFNQVHAVEIQHRHHHHNPPRLAHVSLLCRAGCLQYTAHPDVEACAVKQACRTVIAAALFNTPHSAYPSSPCIWGTCMLLLLPTTHSLQLCDQAGLEAATERCADLLVEHIRLTGCKDAVTLCPLGGSLSFSLVNKLLMKSMNKESHKRCHMTFTASF
jgi:hypothetical protein